MSNRSRFFVSKGKGLVGPDGRPSGHFAVWLDRISVISEGIANFIGEDGSGTITADEVAQGVTNRVIELANQEIARNTDGTISQIVYKDPDTAAVVLTEDFTYSPTGQVEEIKGTDSGGNETIETFTYNQDLIDQIDVRFNF